VDSGRQTLEPFERAQAIVDIIANKMGADILLLDLQAITVIADYFVIATAESTRQLRAIREDLAQTMKNEHGIPALASEGTDDSGWLLLDYGSVVVHLFSPEQRTKYDLETLWGEARTVVRIA